MCIKTSIQLALIPFLFSLIVSVNVSAESINTYRGNFSTQCFDAFGGLSGDWEYDETVELELDFTVNEYSYSANGEVNRSGFLSRHTKNCNGGFRSEPFGDGFKITNANEDDATIFDGHCNGKYFDSSVFTDFTIDNWSLGLICNKTLEICSVQVPLDIGPEPSFIVETYDQGLGLEETNRLCVASGTLLLVNTETVVGPMVSYEFEDLTFTNSTGQNFVQSKSKSSASNGAYFQYNSDAVGQFVTFPISVSTAGTYNLNLQYHLTRYRGTFLVEVSDDPNTGYVEIGRQDMTVASGASFETLLMMHPFMTTGTKYLRFRVTGSNPTTGSERMGLDKIDVMLQ